jgi:hypothetical protein
VPKIVSSSIWPWGPLAQQALTAAGTAAGSDHAIRLLNLIADRYGVTVFPLVIISWIDTMLIRTGILTATITGNAQYLTSPPEIKFSDDTGYCTDNSDDLPAPNAWAIRLILSRATGDVDTYKALMSVPGDSEVWAERVSALLLTCGRTIAHRAR